MSSQYAKLRRMAAVLIGSLASMLPSASSDNTTPQPNVVVGLVALQHGHLVGGVAFIEMAKYKPARPPPDTELSPRRPTPQVRSFLGQCAGAPIASSKFLRTVQPPRPRHLPPEIAFVAADGRWQAR